MVTCYSSPTSGAQQSAVTPWDPVPGSYIRGVCSCFLEATPLGLPEMDWGGDPNPTENEIESKSQSVAIHQTSTI